MSVAGRDLDAVDDEASSMTTDQKLTIVATGLGLFMIFVDALIVNVALPDIQAGFDTGEAGLQWTVVAYTVGMAVMIMSAATLADLYGRRRLYVIGLICFTTASAVAGLAPMIAILVAARAVQGVAAAVITVSSLALLSAAFPAPGAKAKAIGIWTALASLGTALGPSIGGVLTEISWRTIFYVNVPVGAVALLLTLRFVAESRDPSDRSLDPLGQILFIVAVGSLAYAVIEGQQDSFASPEIIGLFVAFAVVLAWFVAHELGSADPMMDVRLFGNETYTLAIVTMFVAYFGIYGSFLVVSQYVQNVRDYSAIETGGFLLPFAVAVGGLSPGVGGIVARRGPGRPILFGVVALVAGLLLMALGMSYGIALVPVGMGVAGIGAALSLVPITSLAMSSAPDERAGMASGIMSAQRALGSTVGYAVMGTILTIWLSATLATDLETVLPLERERDQIATEIVDQADPRAYTAELGPKRPVLTSDRQDQVEILAIADDEFSNGIQLSLGAAAGLLVIVLLVDAARLPRGFIGSGEAADRAS